ncbi:hypothetical protein KCU83_g61, partial [Aureobasidium melanogenum]
MSLGPRDGPGLALLRSTHGTRLYQRSVRGYILRETSAQSVLSKPVALVVEHCCRKRSSSIALEVVLLLDCSCEDGEMRWLKEESKVKAREFRLFINLVKQVKRQMRGSDRTAKSETSLTRQSAHVQ